MNILWTGCEAKTTPIETRIPFVSYMLRKAARQMRPRWEFAFSSSSLTIQNQLRISKLRVVWEERKNEMRMLQERNTNATSRNYNSSLFYHH